MNTLQLNLQQQPSRTSCGPTCIAMLANVPVATILDALPEVRTKSRRNHCTTVAEVLRLLKPYFLTLGRRMQHEPPPMTGQYLLRIEHARGRGWHWAILNNGVVLDPAKPEPSYLGRYDNKVSWYAVEERTR